MNRTQCSRRALEAAPFLMFAALLLLSYAARAATSFTKLYSFPPGTFNDTMPAAGPSVKSPDGTFYGTTPLGGKYAFGSIYKMTAAGKVTTVAEFDGKNGAYPAADLIYGADGSIYGTADQGPKDSSKSIFRMARDGTISTLFKFNGINGDGDVTLIDGRGSWLFGTTSGGGASDKGTVFKVSMAGVLTTLVNFPGIPDGGEQPEGPLTIGPDGNLYGTTTQGGTDLGGTLFRVSSEGLHYSDLVNFSRLTSPFSVLNLVAGRDRFIYGATGYGGVHNQGSIFKLATSGSFETIVRFGADTEGTSPAGPISVGPDGTLYGIAATHQDDAAAASATSKFVSMVYRIASGDKIIPIVKFSSSNADSASFYPSGALMFGPGKTIYGVSQPPSRAKGATIYRIALP